MKESYGKGVATHADPESCVGVREGVDEALTGARAGRVLSRESVKTRVPTFWIYAEGNTRCIVTARCIGALRGLRPRACTEPPRARTGRSRFRPREVRGLDDTVDNGLSLRHSLETGSQPMAGHLRSFGTKPHGTAGRVGKSKDVIR